MRRGLYFPAESSRRFLALYPQMLRHGAGGEIPGEYHLRAVTGGPPGGDSSEDESQCSVDWLVNALSTRKDVSQILKVSRHPWNQSRVFALGRTVGRGSFGKVKKASVFDPQGVEEKVLACKIIKKRDKYKHHWTREVQIFPLLTHHYIVHCEGVFENPAEIYIFMEYYESGGLDRLLSAQGRLEESLVQKYFRQLMIAICFLHARGICHRDIKPNNLLLDAQRNLRLSDFGLAKFCTDQLANLIPSDTFCGNEKYRSPEHARGEAYDPFMNDLWAISCTAYKMLVGKGPFAAARSRNEVIRLHEKNAITFPSDVEVSRHVQKLLLGLLQTNLTERVNIFGALRSSWFLYELEELSGLPTYEKEKDKVAICRSPEFQKIVSSVNLALIPPNLTFAEYLFHVQDGGRSMSGVVGSESDSEDTSRITRMSSSAGMVSFNTQGLSSRDMEMWFAADEPEASEGSLDRFLQLRRGHLRLTVDEEEEETTAVAVDLRHRRY